ncbi:MAG TPA: hypothetical protein VF180_08230 [Acidimicrobiia bacterium]
MFRCATARRRGLAAAFMFCPLIFTAVVAPAPSAAAEGSTITIVKDTVPDGPEDAAFQPSAGVNGGAAFTLDDDGPNTIQFSPEQNAVTFDVEPGVHTVTETGTQGSDLTGITCVDPTGDSTASLSAATATFAVAPGENVVCTFTNTRRGTVTTVQVTLPDSPTVFTYTPSAGINNGAAFLLDDDTPDGSNIADTNVFTVLPGTHSVAQAPVPGYRLVSVLCDDADSTGSTATRTATFRVSAGEDIHCTFTNRPTYGSDPGDLEPEDPYTLDPAEDGPPAPSVPDSGGAVVAGGDGPAGAGAPAVAGDTAAAEPAAEPAAPTGRALLPRTGAGLAGQLFLSLAVMTAGLSMRAVGRRRRGRTQPAG